MWLRLGLCWAFMSTETNTRFTCRLLDMAFFFVAEELADDAEECIAHKFWATVLARIRRQYIPPKRRHKATGHHIFTVIDIGLLQNAGNL